MIGKKIQKCAFSICWLAGDISLGLNLLNNCYHSYNATTLTKTKSKWNAYPRYFFFGPKILQESLLSIHRHFFARIITPCISKEKKNNFQVVTLEN